MKYFILLIGSFFLVSCDQKDLEKFAFKKTLEIMMADKCVEEKDACVAAVKAQVEPCMEKSNWRQYVENKDDKAESDRFVKEFSLCIVDENGKPYFEPEQKQE